MELSDCGPADQLFTHIEPDRVTIRTFNVTWLMVETVAGRISPEYASVEFNQQHYDEISKHNGVEEDHLAKLSSQDLKLPLMFADFENGEMVLIDGNHRAVKNFRNGVRIMDAFVFSKAEWEKCLIQADLPEELLNTIKAQI